MGGGGGRAAVMRGGETAMKQRLIDERQRLGSENQTCILMVVKTVTWRWRDQVMRNRMAESWRMKMSVIRDRVADGPLVGTRKAGF